MTEDDELAQIRKKKLEELMTHKQEILAPKPPTVIEVFEKSLQCCLKHFALLLISIHC